VILVFPGSFDPVTKGHLDVALRSSRFADKVIFAVFENPSKRALFTVSERLRFIAGAVAETSLGIASFEIDSFSGLLGEYAKKKNAAAILRGLRNSDDFAAELPYSIHNKNLSGGVDTLYLASDPGFSHISSSIVKEIASYAFANEFGEDALAKLVPDSVFEALKEKYTKKVEG